MAVSITTPINHLYFSLNPILVGVNSSLFLVQAYQAGVYTITVDSTPNTSEFIEFSWLNNTEKLEVKNGAQLNGEDLPPPSAQTPTQWAAAAVPYLQANYKLNRDFSISAVNADIVLTPRHDEVGALSYAFSASFSSDPAGQPVQAIYNNNIVLFCRAIVVDDNGEETALSPLQAVPDKDGNAQFNVAALIHQQLTPFLPGVSEVTGVYSPVKSINKEVYLEFHEYDQFEDKHYSLTTSQSFRVQRGGVQQEIYPNFISNTDQLINLDWEENRQVLLSRPDFFFFLVNSQSGAWQVRLDFEIHKYDYQLDDVVTDSVQGPVWFSVERLRPIFLQFAFSGIPLAATESLSRVDITIVFRKDGVNFPDNIKRSYTFEEETYRDLLWLYQTSFGVPKLLLTSTSPELEADFESATFEAQRPTEVQPHTLQEAIYDQSYRDELRVNTRNLSYRSRVLLKDLKLSQAIYLFPEANKYLAYYLSNENLEIGSPEDDYRLLELMLKASLRQNIVSPNE